MWLCLRLLGTVLFGSLMLVATIALADKALTPIPREPEVAPADARLARENADLRADLLAARADLARLAAENATLRINVEGLMKVAVFPPRTGPRIEVAPGDMIPPTALPVPTRPEWDRANAAQRK